MSKLVFGVILAFFSVSFVHSNSAFAVTASDWQAGNIISDTVFYNSSSMSTDDIENFLKAKVPVCNTNHSAAYGYSAPFTCLKDYSADTTSMSTEAGLCDAYTGGVKSGAQIIHDVAQSCKINPQVLMVLLQKEQSLITDTWPDSGQYASATGYACPDTSSCNTSYAGFFNQVYYAARQYKLYQKNASSYSYRIGRASNVSYNPSSSCGSSSVYIQGQGTAALYNYTPYQPNAAALANMYGTGDSCSSYGNRNFWRMFNDWFGPTNDTDSFFEVTDTNPTNGLNIWYLITPTGRYMIPSLEIYYAWGLNKYSFQSVDSGYFNSLPDRGTLGHTLKDKYGNMFFVDNMQAHYIRNSNYTSLWGLSNESVVQSTGLVYNIQGGDWTGRFMKDITTGELWLMDGGQKHFIANNSALLYQWGYVPDQVTNVSSTYLSTLANGGDLSRYFTSNGANYLADSGRSILLGDSNLQSAFNSSGTYLNIASSVTQSYLASTSANVFVENADTGGWYLLEGGKKHYIPDIQTAQNWGYKLGTTLLKLSGEYMSSLSDGGTLTSIVKDPSGSIWVLDGQKHLVNDNVKENWVTSGSTLTTVTSQSLDNIPTGSAVGKFIKPANAAFVYVVINGVKHYLQNTATQQGWNASSITSLSSTLVDEIPEGRFANQVVRSQSSGLDYILDGSVAYPIATSLASNWEDGSTPVVVPDDILSYFSISSTQLGLYFKNNDKYYLVSDGQAIPLVSFVDTYNVSSDTPTLANNPFSVQNQASYIVSSTDKNDTNMWFINFGKKIKFPSFAEAANYGYVSNNQSVTALSPSVLDAIPDSSDPASLLIRKDGAGIKLLSFGYSLGFPDGATIADFTSSSNLILTVAPSVYDRFQLRRATSYIVRDDDNNYYVMQSGKKCLITDKTKLSTIYAGISITYLEGTAIVDLPNGTVIN